jgi:hypothetical protein
MIPEKNGNAPLDHIRELIGERAVVIPIPLGRKGPTLDGWQATTFEHTQSAEYQRLLAKVQARGGNIGVLLGDCSGDLVAIDIDEDQLVDVFLRLNPSLANSLRTRGQRGCQIWLRMATENYPQRKTDLKFKDGRKFCEWRGGGGCQSVIFGRHPSGNDYQILVDTPAPQISFDEIVWPEGLALPWNQHSAEPQNGNAQQQPAPSLDHNRIRAYLAKASPAISGQNGHGTTFRVACALAWGFALDPEQALPFLSEYNVRCEPPWTEKDLRHKLDNALKVQHKKPRGHLLEGGLARKTEAPRKSASTKTSPRLILPGGSVAIIQTAHELFSRLASTGKYFVRGRLIVELVRNKEGNEVLTPLRAIALRTRIEEDFELWVWRSLRDQKALKQASCPKDIAEALLESNPAVELLPGIRLLTSTPILTEQDGTLIILNRGYHQLYGGVFVECRTDIQDVNIEEAKSSLLNLLSDFDFTTKSDLSRAVASFISPALRFGRLLDADFPLDLAEADQSQSGKTYRQRLVSALYKETSYVVTRRERGVGSLDESISSALLSGRPFIAIENVRGVLDSQILESALRGHGHVNVRVPHKGEVQLQTDHICWQLSSNQAATTRDLSNRSIITRIRKRHLGYRYKSFNEGDLLTHIRCHHGYYLGCVFAIVRAWFKAGKPRTDEYRHDFREWTQTLDWIVQNLFGLPPLLDGHREEQERISNPHLNWLRDVALVVDQLKKLDAAFRVSELVDLCASQGVEVPGHRHDDQQIMLAGKILNKLFRDSQTLAVGGYQVRREQRTEYNSEQRREMTVNYFWFERPTL